MVHEGRESDQTKDKLKCLIQSVSNFTDTVFLSVFPGKDVATNVEVYWPDGRSVARPLEPSDVNSVLEIRYPKDEDEITPTAEIEVHCFDRVQRDTLSDFRIICCVSLMISRRYSHFQVFILKRVQ